MYGPGMAVTAAAAFNCGADAIQSVEGAQDLLNGNRSEAWAFVSVTALSGSFVEAAATAAVMAVENLRLRATLTLAPEQPSTAATNSEDHEGVLRERYWAAISIKHDAVQRRTRDALAAKGGYAAGYIDQVANTACADVPLGLRGPNPDDDVD
jgi:hypothetical protein